MTIQRLDVSHVKYPSPHEDPELWVVCWTPPSNVKTKILQTSLSYYIFGSQPQISSFGNINNVYLIRKSRKKDRDHKLNKMHVEGVVYEKRQINNLRRQIQNPRNKI